MYRQGIARNGPFVGTVQQDGKSIGGRFGSDALSGKVPSQQIADKGRLANTVLSHQQYLRFGFLIGGQERGRGVGVKEEG